MMRVSPAPKPDTFDRRVRQPGLRALDRLARKFSVPKSEIPSDRFPDHWRKSLEEYAEDYWSEYVTLDYLTRRAPFVANELRRQNRLRPGDT